MKNQVDVRSLLDVFETVRRHGHYTEKGMELEDIVGVDTGDGYSLSLSDGEVSVDLSFHNTYHFHLVEQPHNINHTKQKAAELSQVKIADFVAKLENLNRKYH